MTGDVGSSSSGSQRGPLGWLNKPFTLWFLTSVVLGLIAFSYRNYSACKTDLAHDENLLRSNLYELNQRWPALHNDLVRWPAGSNEQYEVVKRYLERSDYFYSSETKDKSLPDLVHEIERITRKWYPEAATDDAVQHYRMIVEKTTKFGPAPPGPMQGGPRLAAIISTAWDIVPQYKELDEAARRWVSQPNTLGRAQPSYTEFARLESYMNYWVYGLAKLLFDNRDTPFLSPNLCFGEKLLFPDTYQDPSK